MGIFNLFKKKDKPVSVSQAEFVKVAASEEDKCYQSDPYERKIITFEDRKKTAVPSNTGLYPAEILLLEYCSRGIYPRPKNGYPQFWWFTYGIRDVEAVLKTLEERGYIAFALAKDSIKEFTVQQLKDLLASKGYPTTGKKAELIARVADVIPEEDLLAAGVQLKYALTEMGKQELTENAYVPYMHSVHNKTTEDARIGMTFNIWSINKLLGTGDKSNWKEVVEEQERKMNKENADKNEALMENLKKIDSGLYEELNTQNQQIAAVQKARDKYNEDKDLDSYMAFWEMIWKNGGLKFEGVGWHFELANLYIKAKRYDDALAFVSKLKKIKPTYADKSDAYIKKIEELKAKQVAKK